MNVVPLPVNLPANANAKPAAKAALQDNERDEAPVTDKSGDEPFSAVLAKQLDTSAAPAPVVLVAVPDAREPEPTALDPALQLQQAALFMPAPIVNEIKVVPQQVMSAERPIDAMAAFSTPAQTFELNQAAQRQPVAANAAAFAVPEVMPEAMSEAVREAAAKLVAAKDALVNAEPSFSAQTLVQPQALPQGAAVIAQTSSLPAADSTQSGSNIQLPVGHSAWGQALGERVVWMVGQQHQGVELHLNPPALGPLEVRLSMSDGQANLSFASHHAAVREAIESATPRLREMLGESGITLASVSVNVGSFTQHQPGQQPQSGSGTGTSWLVTPQTADAPAATVTTVVSPLHGLGKVDIFA